MVTFLSGKYGCCIPIFFEKNVNYLFYWSLAIGHNLPMLELDYFVFAKEFGYYVCEYATGLYKTVKSLWENSGYICVNN